MDKKAEGTPIWLVIAIVLGIIVLVVVALGFITGFEGLLDFFNIFPGSTLAKVEQSCTFACNSESVAGYCTELKTIDDLDESQITNLNLESCDDPSYKGGSCQVDKSKIKVTCQLLAEKKLITPCEKADLCSRIKNSGAGSSSAGGSSGAGQQTTAPTSTGTEQPPATAV